MPTELINDPKRNQILGALPLAEFARLASDLELVRFKAGDIVYAAGDRLDFVHFPTSCTVSLAYSTESGASSELAMTGIDGLVGLPLILGGATTTHTAKAQCDGAAYRVRGEVIRWELEQGGMLLRLTLAFVQALMTQMAQGVVCNRHHRVEQQLARWLLTSLDLHPEGMLVVTQEEISRMLGVRREAVTEAAGHLQAAGLIKYSRGHITVVDRAALQTRACECYGVVKQEYERLFSLTSAHKARNRARPNPHTLRSRAEALLKKQKALAPTESWDKERLLHELQVHQIELELHNEELRLAYEESDALRNHCADIYDFAPVGYFTLDVRGVILDLNLAGAILIGIKRSEHARYRFSAFVDAESLSEYNRFVADVMAAKGGARCVVRLAPATGAAPVIARLDAVSDESGQECRMVVTDISAPCTDERRLKGCQYIPWGPASKTEAQAG